jgi:hypothetical protein
MVAGNSIKIHGVTDRVGFAAKLYNSILEVLLSNLGWDTD